MGLFDKIKKVFKKEEIKEKEELKLYDKGLEKTRVEFTSKLGKLSKKYREVTKEYFEELEEVLVMADIGVNTVMDFINKHKCDIIP